MIQVEDLPLSWFDRPQDRPRIRMPDGRESWFVLSGVVPRETSVPLTAPREPPGGRAAVRSAFLETYGAWRIAPPPEAARSFDALATPGTALVVAGQQPGFLASPLHAFYKALGAIAVARRIALETGRPAVPVFWVAGDDHDLDEVRAGIFPAPGGGESIFRYPHPADRRPIVDHPIDKDAERVVEEAAVELSRRRRGGEAARLARLYMGRNVASGFAAVLNELLGGEGLLVIDPVRLRPLARGIIRKVIEAPLAVLEAIEDGRREVKALGMEPLVAARLPLFLIQEGRRMHLAASEGGLRIDGGGPHIPANELLEMLERSPEVFSHGALLRPLVQDEVLPSLLSIGGPAEIGYYAQIGPLARLLGVPVPRIGLRPNATLVDGKSARIAREAGIERIATAARPEDFLPCIEEPPAIRDVKELAAAAEDLLVRAVAENVSPARAPRLQARAKEIAEDMRRLADRIVREGAGAENRTVATARLWEHVFPGGELQERRWTVLHFIAKHGTEWIGELLRVLERDPLGVAHRWITFDG